MRRLPAIAFSALVVATVSAFFITQHLKVTTPLLTGIRGPTPAAINPWTRTVCKGIVPNKTQISFYLLHRADDVDVYVLDRNGDNVRTIASGHHMRRGVRDPDGDFSWNGHEDNGAVAPDGTYRFVVSLIHQARRYEIGTVTIKTVPPHPVVQSVSPALMPQGNTPVTIRYSGNAGHGGTVLVYRTDLPGGPLLANNFGTPWVGSTVKWDLKIRGHPAPAGTYLVAVQVLDPACNAGQYPPIIPPQPGTTRHDGVTVRYLAGQPPLDPVAPGSTATVYVDSRQQPYQWSLWRQGARKPAASGQSLQFDLGVRVPGGSAGLYTVALRSGSYFTAVPLVAHASRPAPVLVVLPALSWQGVNPVDDDDDGLPDTLSSGQSISLARPLANGLPPGFTDEAALLAYLDRTHRPYDLTTDLGVLDGVGPLLSGHAAVVLAGTEQWLPSLLAGGLRTYVQNGGHVVSFGIDSMRRTVIVRGGRAVSPGQPSAADALGAHVGSVVSANTSDLVVIRDGLGIFNGTSGVFTGFGSYQPFAGVSSPATILSEAGTSASAPSIIGYRLGRGIVIDVGLPGFASTLASSVDAQQLLDRIWSVVSKG